MKGLRAFFVTRRNETPSHLNQEETPLQIRKKMTSIIFKYINFIDNLNL